MAKKKQTGSPEATGNKPESASGELAKLEQQMAALQNMIAAEQLKRSTLRAEMAAKQQAANAIRGQIQQSEMDLASAAMQQELIEKAFGKK